MLWRWPSKQRFSCMTWRRLRGARYPGQKQTFTKRLSLMQRNPQPFLKIASQK